MEVAPQMMDLRPQPSTSTMPLPIPLPFAPLPLTPPMCQPIIFHPLWQYSLELQCVSRMMLRFPYLVADQQRAVLPSHLPPRTPKSRKLPKQKHPLKTSSALPLVHCRRSTAKPSAAKQGDFTCPTCRKPFSREWLLNGHLRTHTGEKPFTCEQCGKSFADKSNLRAHKQTHSHDKPFVCEVCHKQFKLKSYLSKHGDSKCERVVEGGDKIMIQ